MSKLSKLIYTITWIGTGSVPVYHLESFIVDNKHKVKYRNYIKVNKVRRIYNVETFLTFNDLLLHTGR